jgi:hypothetical protein
METTEQRTTAIGEPSSNDNPDWVQALTFNQWLVLASRIDQSSKWAFYRWQENTSQNLSELSLEDWEKIAQHLDYSDNWAYRQYKEHNP